ncbi:uncharacterized protein LOC108953773 [Musa acuminata AAA Group]|uniref:uncharacterized protein LOC108953773 n=1 Tax=Musa acuminata AAA Group TaxID=214697 RepID=UPI0031D68AFC
MMEGGHAFGKLPDHLLTEIFVRVPICEWSQISCVNKHRAEMFRGESLWQTAIIRTWPFAVQRARWPGPIPRGFGISLSLPSNYRDSATIWQFASYQFIACGRSRDKAHELASEIWLAVINNLEENKHMFLLLKRFAQEGDLFLPFPYSRSYKVLWRVFEKLFTDFRDCLSRADFYDVLACAKSMFQPVPSTWLGY